jgi:TonB-dependent heme/hemoglobin receptor
MTNTWRTGLLVSPLFFLSVQCPVFAAEPFGEDLYEPGLQEHVHVTATRTSKRDIDTAAAVTAIDEAAILEQAPDVIAEMLRSEPGAFFQQTTPGQGIPIIRGLKGSQVLHMVDGMRLNNAFFRNAPNQYLGLVDSFSAQRVEVVRGSQGSLYGADAMGGVVNILTIEPVYDSSDWRQDSRLYGSYDSADQGWVFSARTRGGKRGWGFSGGVSYQDHSDRESGNGETLAPSAYKSKAADIKFLAATSEHSELMVAAQVMEQPSTPRYDELVPGYGQQAPSAWQFLFEPNRREFLHARFRLEGNSAWFDRVEAHAARQVITDDRLTQDYGSPEITAEDNRSTLDGVTLQFNSSLESGISLVWGAEYYRDAVDSRRFVRTAGSDAAMEVRSRFPDGSSMDSAAVYLSGEWLQTRNFDLNAGLRYSWFDIQLPTSEDYDAVKLTPSDLTGDIHAVYAVSDNFKWVANIGRGFRPPNIFDLATLGPRSGNRFNVVNSELGPETVWSYDLGFKMETGLLEFEAFAFYMDYRDKITTVLTGGTTAGGRDIVRSENRAEVELYGIETGLFWAATQDLRVFAVLNYTRGEESEDVQTTVPADRVPPLNGKLGLEYFFNDNWRLEPYLLFAARQDRLSPRDVRDPRINPAGTAGWGTLNMLLDWQVTDALQLGLRLENLLDKSYREHASGIDAAGRNIGLWVNYGFYPQDRALAVNHSIPGSIGFWLSLPLAAAQGLWLRRNAPRLPEAAGDRQGSTGRGNRLRLLAMGDSIIAGVGLQSMTESLPVQFAAALADKYRCCVEWRLEGRNGADIAELISSVRQLGHEQQADVILISVGVNDVTGLSSKQRWRSQVNLLLDELKGRWPAAKVIFAGLPPMGEFPLLPQPLRFTLGYRAAGLDRIAAEMLQNERHMLHVPTRIDPLHQAFCSDGFHPSTESCKFWAIGLAERTEADNLPGWNSTTGST